MTRNWPNQLQRLRIPNVCFHQARDLGKQTTYIQYNSKNPISKRNDGINSIFNINLIHILLHDDGKREEGKQGYLIHICILSK
jgi:hypothetical protein